MQKHFIESLEQVPTGLNLLLERLDTIDERISLLATCNAPALSPAHSEVLHTRVETAKILHITLATLNDYTKTGKIRANRIGNRVLYKDADIQDALQQVITSKTPNQHVK